jgi:hypothetical protein
MAPVPRQTDGFQGKMETLCPLVMVLLLLVGDCFENHLVERRMVSDPPERSLEAA